MARDRNVYVWQAYVTVMSIVSLACIGALAFVIFQSGTNRKAVEGAIDKEQKAQAALRDESNRRQLVENMLGVVTASPADTDTLKTQVTPSAEMTSAIATYEKNMALFGPGATNRNYTNLVTVLTGELRSRNMQVDSAARREIDLSKDFESKLEQETKAREAEKRNAQDLSSQREKDLVKYTEDVRAQEEKITKIELDKQNLVKSYEKKLRDLKKDYDDCRTKIVDMEKRLEQLGNKLNEIQGEDFQYVQGKVVNISNGSSGDLVWINLGKADNLRPGVKFGVVGTDVSRVADLNPKAQIEVIEVKHDHLAFCKVVSGKSSIILVGDAIYSPAWQPGRTTEFALVGKMDIDGDGKDDREIVKALIERNGGKVTLDLPPGGKATGKLTIDTRWMVMGEDFKVRGELTNADSVIATERRNLESEAKSLAISRINLDKLMGWLRGSGDEVSTLGAGMRAKVTDFRAQPPQTSTSGGVAQIYLNRNGNPNQTASPPEAK